VKILKRWLNGRRLGRECVDEAECSSASKYKYAVEVAPAASRSSLAPL